MTDLANLVLAVDSTAVPKATAALEGLTAAGARAEAATAGLGGGFKGAGVEASAMAVAAQASARAAMDQAAGFGRATEAARLNTMAMRETLVVARELSRGNFTRLPGSLTLLAQGIGSQGGIGAYASAIANQLGLIRKVQDAELAEAAAAAASAAAGVRAAAEKAAANVMAADTAIALAEAQVRVTQGTTAEAAAQAKLAAAHEAVAAAAAEAAVAEDALAVAQGRAAETGAKSAAATRTLIGGAGVGIIGIGTVAGIAYGAMKKLQDQIKDDGTLTRYRASLGLTHSEMLKLSDGVDKAGGKIKELTDVAPTLGDVMHGVFGEIAKEANNGSAWDHFKSNVSSTFDGVLSIWNQTSAAISAGMWTLGDIAKDVFQYIAQKIGQGFYDGVNKAIDAINSLNAKIPKWAGGGDANLISHLKADPSVSTLGGLSAKIKADSDKNYAAALAANNSAYAGIRTGTINSAKARMKAEADALKADRRAKKGRNKKPNDHGLAEALAKLQAEIKGQYDLAAAYGVSAAAAQRAEANQKAAEDALQHKGGLDQFKALELQKLVAEDVSKQAKTNAGLNTELSIRAQLNARLADGTLTVGEYNEQLKLQTTLNGLNADLDNADAQHKGVVRDVIKQTNELYIEQNQLRAQFNALSQVASNDNEIARLRLENSLIGASNKERATAIAQLTAMQQLKEIDPNGLLTRGERDSFTQSAITKAQLSVQTPFQQWAASVPQTAQAVTEALQQIEFRGFDNLASSIAGVVTGTKSLGQAFKDISQQIIGDIIQMTVKMLIFRAISSIFGGGIGGPDLSAPMSTSFSGVAPSLPGGFRAAGGSVNAGEAYMVGEKGPELFRPSQSGTIIPNGGNDNRQGPVEVIVHVATDENFHASVQQVAGQVVVAAAPQIVKASVQSTMAVANRKTLNGRR